MEEILRNRRKMEIGLVSEGFGRWKCALVFIGEGVSELQNRVRLKNDVSGFFYSSIQGVEKGQSIIIGNTTRSVGYIEDTGKKDTYEVHWEGTRYNGMDMKSTSCAFRVDTTLPHMEYNRLTECILSEVDSSHSFILVADFSQRYSRELTGIMAHKIVKRGVAVSVIISMPERDHPEFYDSRNDLRDLRNLTDNIIDVNRTSPISRSSTGFNGISSQSDKIQKSVGSAISKIKEIMR